MIIDVKGSVRAADLGADQSIRTRPDVYFSADVETDGPIPGEYSMLSFALVEAGRFDGSVFCRPERPQAFYRELKPISASFQKEALDVNRLDRERLKREGADPAMVMSEASRWVEDRSADGTPVLVAYPLSFDWSWLYWYFVHFTAKSPFEHSRCFDLKTAIAVKGGRRVNESGRSRVPRELQPSHPHTHHARDDAMALAELFANVFEWPGR